MKIYTIHNMRDIDLRLSPRRLGPVTIKAKKFVKLSLDDDTAKAFGNTAGIKVKLEKPPEKPKEPAEKKKKKRVAAGSSPAEVEAAKIKEKNKP